MSDEQHEQEQQQEAAKTYTAAEVEEMTKGLKAKVDELLGEKKTVSQRARELEEAQAAAEQERLKEKEEFKTLWEREQQAKKELQEKYETFSKQVQQKEVEITSSSIAEKIAVERHFEMIANSKVSHGKVPKNRKYRAPGYYFDVAMYRFYTGAY